MAEEKKNIITLLDMRLFLEISFNLHLFTFLGLLGLFLSNYYQHRNSFIIAVYITLCLGSAVIFTFHRQVIPIMVSDI